MKNMPGEVVKKALLDLGLSGLYGTASDFRKWLEFSRGWKLSDDEVLAALNELCVGRAFRQEGEYIEDFLATRVDSLPDRFAFDCPRDVEDSPIQFFRSRLLSFLRQKGIPSATEVDIVIASVEAMENAVKYSSNGAIGVVLEVDGPVFRIEVVNQIPPATPDRDIEVGKYDSSRTLMRGMMVMSRLFDEMDIGIDEERRNARFHAWKRIRAAT